MTLQDYIKLAENAVAEGNMMTVTAWSLIEKIPAMAKALIEAEEALKASMLTMKNHQIHAPVTLSLQKKALSQIQALNGGENDKQR